MSSSFDKSFDKFILVVLIIRHSVTESVLSARRSSLALSTALPDTLEIIVLENASFSTLKLHRVNNTLIKKFGA